jgi:hypothetical protein
VAVARSTRSVTARSAQPPSSTGRDAPVTAIGQPQYTIASLWSGHTISVLGTHGGGGQMIVDVAAPPGAAVSSSSAAAMPAVTRRRFTY